MSETHPQRRKSIRLSGIALLALFGGVAAAWITDRIGTPRPPQLQAATPLLSQAKPLPAFQLTDSAGQPFDNSRLAGHWSWMFFGYTYCPDICPTTLATLNTAMQLIAGQGGVEDTQIVFVSVDPERDTPKKLKEYVDYFNPGFIGVTGRAPEIDELTRALGILHTRVPSPSGDGAYLMDHSASILLIGPEGKLVALFSVPHKAQWLASDFEKLRDYYEGS